MSVIAIDLGHRFGRVARVGPDGEPAVITTELAVDGVLDPVRALPRLIGSVPAAAEGVPAAEPDRTAVLGLPVSDGREDELRYVVERAGFDVARVVPEPVAVALHYQAIAEGVDHTILVCDQGATTLDLSVLAIAPDLTVHLVRALSLRLGGDDWDAALASDLVGRLPDGVDPMSAAESLRRALGGSDRGAEFFEDASGVRHEVTLERGDFERAVAPLREQLLAAVAEQLTTAEPAVDTVLLAGGMCVAADRRAEIEALPAAQGLTVRCSHPELAVVLGLFTLRDFGVLRVVTGPAARPGLAEPGFAGLGTGYPRVAVDTLLDPEPAGAAATDPEPGAGRPRAQDPEPAARQGTLLTGTDPGRARQTTAAGRRDGAFEAPESETDGGPSADPPSAEPPTATPAEPPHPEATYSDPLSAESPYTPPSYTDAPSTPSPEFPAIPPTGSPLDPQAAFAVPVDQLQALRRGDHLLVLWAWPAGALSARVRWRREGNVAGLGTERGDDVCRRRVYEHDGGFDLAVGRGAVTVTVEALVAELGDGCEGASSLLVPTAPTVVVYEPSVRRRFTGRAASVTFTSETGCDLPEVRIVLSLGRFRPTSIAEGTVLHEVPAQRLAAGTPLTVQFPLPATRGPSWLVCFPADADAGTDAGIDIRPTALHRLRVT
ncbi:Hsp70 family protein [Streptomyces poriferorum]|uniref:Hsp70 family protein n=1 Tax=Streptomyces poriferorum TaxID=2798799 RepID=UPI00273F9947|nr:Hsp70 family protein [Streptomyces sp. Alt1]WLQ47096.1 Hsp70 family protein [Streptomyces sp. Alt1]